MRHAMPDHVELTADPAPGAEQAGRSRTFLQREILLLLLAVGVFVALGTIAGEYGSDRVDVAVTRDLQSVRWPPLVWLLVHVSDVGFQPLAALSYIVVALCLVLVRLPLEAVIAVGGSGLAVLAGGVVKLLVRRMRPTASLVHVVGHLTDYSFPSGHVVHYTTLLGFALYVVYATWQGSLLKRSVMLVLLTLIALVGPSRVYLGQHWATDVTAAYLFGGVWLAAMIELHLLLKQRIKRGWRRPPWSV